MHRLKTSVLARGKWLVWGMTCMLLFSGCTNKSGKKDKSVKNRPHIVFILADDLGWGDVRAYNPESNIPTPNIDQLAEQGLQFMDAHSSASVCSPTRYGLLTGRYSWRTRLKRGVLWPPAEPLIAKDRPTIATVLQDAGYYTAIVGKWHLGLGWTMVDEDSINYRQPLHDTPNDHGFDYSFIFAGSADMKPYTFIENRRVTEKPTAHAPGGRFGQAGPQIPGLRPPDILPRFTREALDVIDRQAQRDNENPLFLYFPLTAPHKPVAPAKPYKGKTPLGDYGDFVYQVDAVVGKVVDRLKKHGMYKNTILIVTSDNGTSPNAAEQAMEQGHDVNGPFRGYKATIWEGGHRIPLVVTWPGRIPAGKEIGERVSLNDFMTTFAALTDQQLAANAAEDSYNLLPLLLGNDYEKPLREATVARSGGGCLAILRGPWKLANCPGSGSGWAGTPTTGKAKKMGLPPVQLYNLKADTNESNNLQDRRPAKVDSLQKLLEKYKKKGRSTPAPGGT